MSNYEFEKSIQRDGFLPHPRMAHIDYFSLAEQERTKRMLKITRYDSVKDMTHRSNDALHELRVTMGTMFASTMLLHLGIDHDGLDQIELLFKAGHHDDPEMKTGDTPSNVKRAASPEEKARMEQEDLEAIDELEWMIPKPVGFSNFKDAYKEYKEQKRMPDRLINYWDKFDGLHEAINEVVCGENPEGFKKVIREYADTFKELREKNTDWMPYIEKFLGEGFFDFPDVDSLPTGRKPEDFDYANKDTFIESVAKGAPKSYAYWLKVNQFIFRKDFLPRTFPGWQYAWPDAIEQDLHEVQQGSVFKTTASGLLVPRDPKNYPTFAETLLESTILEGFDIKAAVIRMVEGIEASGDDRYFAFDPSNY